MFYALGAIVLGAVALGIGLFTLKKRQAGTSDDTQIPKLMIGAGLLLTVAVVLLVVVAATRGW